jgi:DNA-binding response OmpR family regulator
MAGWATEVRQPGTRAAVEDRGSLATLDAMTSVLVVDDEPQIVEVVAAYLRREGYTVVTATRGDEALARMRSAPPDLVVLDLMLPGRSGFDVLREMRSAGIEAAVIMLTARDDLVDRVSGLELGADDYVTKPFEPRELVARVGAVLRRSHAEPGGGRPAAATPGPGSSLEWFDLAIDLEAREVSRGGQPIGLTRTEFDLVAAFAAQPGRAWSREQLGLHVFGEAFDSFDRSIDSHVKNLRHKLGDRPGGGPYVETVRGVGYRGARR